MPACAMGVRAALGFGEGSSGCRLLPCGGIWPLARALCPVGEGTRQLAMACPFPVPPSHPGLQGIGVCLYLQAAGVLIVHGVLRRRAVGVVCSDTSSPRRNDTYLQYNRLEFFKGLNRPIRTF
ncbi:hypothetical protein SEVIR_4G259100v4 [Setaria viridis]|uniref:Uncharacterized protein n=1 Tax=Setaria viridis TaxID=4556 RepID=A0A4U6V1Q4_SETVI|nr:hypothetical protein SEVIR_4G259100v2 [Setaria viridis]